MTNDEIDKAIAEFCGWDWWAVEKGGWWYRENGCGYTASLLEAGKYTKDAAEKQLVRGEPMSIRMIPHPSYSTDFTAMREAEQILFTRYHYARDIFIDRLCRIMDPVNGYRKQSAIDIIDATAEQHARALVETIKQIKP